MPDRVVVYRDAAREWRWRRVAANGQVIATSGEGYVTRWGARRAARRVHPDLTIELAPFKEAP